jgi:hypothetical protein
MKSYWLLKQVGHIVTIGLWFSRVCLFPNNSTQTTVPTLLKLGMIQLSLNSVGPFWFCSVQLKGLFTQGPRHFIPVFHNFSIFKWNCIYGNFITRALQCVTFLLLSNVKGHFTLEPKLSFTYILLALKTDFGKIFYVALLLYDCYHMYILFTLIHCKSRTTLWPKYILERTFLSIHLRKKNILNKK